MIDNYLNLFLQMIAPQYKSIFHNMKMLFGIILNHTKENSYKN